MSINKNEKPGIARIDLTGQDPQLFNVLFEKFRDTVIGIASSLSKAELNAESKTALNEILTATQSFVEAKIKEPSIKNKKLLAEIAAKYAEAEERLARAREKHALAESMELENAQKKLEIAFEMMSKLQKVNVILDSKTTYLDFTE